MKYANIVNEEGRCIDYGGSGICELSRQRSQCIECGGSEICEHSKQRSLCIECKYLKMYMNTYHKCGTEDLFYEAINAYSRNINIQREYEVLAFTKITSDIVILGNVFNFYF